MSSTVSPASRRASSLSLARANFRGRFLWGLMFLPIVSYTIFYEILRPFDAVGLAIPCFFAVAICFLKRHLLFGKSYILFLLWALTLFMLSIVGQMPQSWASHRDTFAAFRQFAPLVLLPVLSTAFFLFFAATWGWLERNALIVLMAVYSLYVSFSFIKTNTEMAGTLYTITNSTVPIWISFILFAFRNKTPKLQSLIGFIIVFGLASSAQSKLLAMLLPMLWSLENRRLVVIGLSASLAVFLVVSPLYPLELYRLDPNTGVRAVMWGDVWRVLADTKGFGVGFGTEYIRDQFGAVTGNAWGLGNYEIDYLYIGTHSTVYDMLLRVGLIGFGLFLLWMIPAIFWSKQAPNGSYGAMFWATAAMFIIVNAVNIGVYSINFLFGISMMVGFMESLRYRAVDRAGHGRTKKYQVTGYEYPAAS